MEPIDVKVYIDDDIVVEGVFPVRYQQNWQKYEVELAPGVHIMRIESEAGKASMTKRFEVQGPQWGVINYWNQPMDKKKNPGMRKFTFELKSQPFYFDN
jgi:hypothetical protein